MRFTAILFVTMIISVALASKMDSFKNAKFSKSKLGKFIMNFAEFTSSVSDVDYTPLFDALDALTDSLEDQLAALTLHHGDAEITHNNLVINYENNRDAANSDINDYNSEINGYSWYIDLFQFRIGDYSSQIAIGNEAIVATNQAATDRKVVYTQDVEDASSGIDTIDEALALLRSLQTTSDVVEFIQTNEQALNNIKIKLQKNFGAIQNKKRSQYRHKPLLMAVVEIMTNQNFINQDILLKVIDLLVDLRGQISDFITLLDSNEATAEEQDQVTLDILNTGIVLSEEGLANAQSGLAETQATIDNYNAMLAARTEEFNEAVAALAAENDLWNEAVQNYNEAVDEINSELRIVSEAVGAFTAGGVTRAE